MSDPAPRCPTCQQPQPPRTTRRCPKCETEKPLAAFSKRDGYCKPCRLAYMREYLKRYRRADSPQG